MVQLQYLPPGAICIWTIWCLMGIMFCGGIESYTTTSANRQAYSSVFTLRQARIVSVGRSVFLAARAGTVMPLELKYGCPYLRHQRSVPYESYNTVCPVFAGIRHMTNQTIWITNSQLIINHYFCANYCFICERSRLRKALRPSGILCRLLGTRAYVPVLILGECNFINHEPNI